MEIGGPKGTGALTDRAIRLRYATGAKLGVRHIRRTLDQPASGGDGAIGIRTHLRARVAIAAVVAQVYRTRWTVGGLFPRVTTVPKREVNTLGYPLATLFASGVALAAGNVYPERVARPGAGSSNRYAP